jgi:hypothetical protein
VHIRQRELERFHNEPFDVQTPVREIVFPQSGIFLAVGRLRAIDLKDGRNIRRAELPRSRMAAAEQALGAISQSFGGGKKLLTGAEERPSQPASRTLPAPAALSIRNRRLCILILGMIAAGRNGEFSGYHRPQFVPWP